MSRLPLALLALALAGASLSCSDPGSESTLEGIDLLDREPDATRESIGRIAPDPVQQWGSLAAGAWSGTTLSSSIGLPARVPSKEPQAGVWLEAAEVMDRTLGIHVGVPGTAKGSKTSIEVLLNSIPIGKASVGRECRRIEIDAPAVLWERGRNLLQLRVEPPESGAGPQSFVMGPVEFGADRRIERKPGLALLQPDTSLTIRFERRGPSQLELSGTLAGTGRLQLAIAPFVPGTPGTAGTPGAQGSEGLEWTFDSDERETLSETIDLAEFTSDHLQLNLEFLGDSGSTASIEQLFLVESEPRPRPPVVLVVVDTLSAKHMSVYGYPRPTTPVLEEFAKDCLVFEHAYSNASWTLPSFQAILTGLYPRSHVLDRPGDAGFSPQLWDLRRIVESRTTLAEAFRSGGWKTFGHFDNMFLGEAFGTRQGFDEYSIEAARLGLEDRGGGIDKIRDDFFMWLDREARDRPFFALLHCLDVHGPYKPEQRWIDEVTQVPTPFELPEQLVAGGLNSNFGLVSDHILDVDEPPPTVDPAPIVDRYDAGIAEVDHKLQALFDGLRERGLYDEALIVLTADHGESMVENSVLFGHSAVFDAVTHIPLMVKLPGSTRGGTRIDLPAQSVDFMPTLLDLCGMDAEPERFHGRSLVPLLEGQNLPEIPILQSDGSIEQTALRFRGMKVLAMDTHAGEIPARLTVRGLETEFLAEHFPEVYGRGLSGELFEELQERFGGLARLNKWLRENTPRWLVLLYDLNADPGETENLAPRRSEEGVELMLLMQQALERAERARVDEVPPTSGGLSEEQLEALQAAGYLED